MKLTDNQKRIEDQGAANGESFVIRASGGGHEPRSWTRRYADAAEGVAGSAKREGFETIQVWKLTPPGRMIAATLPHERS